jgi:hypothetical protein
MRGILDKTLPAGIRDNIAKELTNADSDVEDYAIDTKTMTTYIETYANHQRDLLSLNDQ